MNEVKWISMDRELPNFRVLGWSYIDGVVIGEMIDGEFTDDAGCYISDVKYWADLPEGPEL